MSRLVCFAQPPDNILHQEWDTWAICKQHHVFVDVYLIPFLLSLRLRRFLWRLDSTDSSFPLFFTLGKISLQHLPLLFLNS